MTTVNRCIRQESEKLLIHLKPDEFYSFIFDRETATDALRMTGRLAANPDLAFNWHDAALVAQKIRSISDTTEQVAVVTIDPTLTERPLLPDNSFGVILRHLIADTK